MNQIERSLTTDFFNFFELLPANGDGKRKGNGRENIRNWKKEKGNRIFRKRIQKRISRSIKNITELSREVILSLNDEIIVFRDKQIKINFKFIQKNKKMMSIIDTQ